MIKQLMIEREFGKQEFGDRFEVSLTLSFFRTVRDAQNQLVPKSKSKSNIIHLTATAV